MTRCVYLTFFGEYRGEGTPHESPRVMTTPLVLLALAAIGVGFLNAPGIEKFNEWVSFSIDSPRLGIHNEFHLEHHAFSVGGAALSVLMGLLGLGIASWVYFGHRRPMALVERSKPVGAVYYVLENKYGFDKAFVDGVAHSVAGPIAVGAYWTNQHIIDGVVNGTAAVVRESAPVVYRYVDQGAIDGTYNGSARLTGMLGGLLRTLQTGRVQRYALYLFSSVIVISLSVAVLT
jgi:NADH-quinone oxidoreductase subunit L